MARWFNDLCEYDFEIRYKAGKKMIHVDASSRAPVDNDEFRSMDSADCLQRFGMYIAMTEHDRIVLIQRSDEHLRKLIQVLRKAEKKRTREEKESVEQYVLEYGRLYREVNENGKTRKLYVIPRSLRKSLVIKFHDLNGHFGLDRTVAAIMKSYWFNGMRRYVKQHIRSCIECLFLKVPSGRQAGMLHPIPVPKRPFERVRADHLDPFMKSKKKNMFVLAIADALTNFVKLYCVKNTSVKPVIRAFEQFTNDFGVP